ncbi:WAT1-related protein At5g64700 isoform X2 [Brachypodium distachyon]|uniref:WAT1-related protein n=1 Tax=Brachypodium distachyon TaxID=15368 RepID=I1HSP1_BRADI|nr:WAT1-related protein At5g64700 isoform X2 [Brachypodium distachyon]KQK10254.1 hypothetical protein BRADI_2g52977v3 [Brachypodium distachyon]|eukprot:XP_014753854.1 WAT1-related protein At5g64700 isoform X2 [Brachypodium distachyon]
MGADGKKPYVVAVIIQVIYAGMFVVSKAAFDQGMNTFVFIFYRQTAASLLLLPLAIILERTTFSLNVYNVSLKFTSAPVGSATSNSLPVITFFLALLLRMEVVKPKSPSGIAKLGGMALCLAGVLVIAFYAGLSLSPINHHRAFNVSSNVARTGDTDHALWIKGTFLMVLANVTWSLWIILQAALLREYPNKLLVTATQCVFSTAQCFVVAVVAEGDFSRWRLRFDVTLLAVLYTGFVVTGVSYYLQAWCTEMRGPVFLAAWNPLCFVLTIFCSSFLGEIVHLGSILGGALLVGGLYAVLWGKSKEDRVVPCGEMSTVDGSESAVAAKSKQETRENVSDEKTMLSSGAEEV